MASSYLSEQAVKRFYGSSSWKDARRVILERDHGVCQICFEYVEQAGPMSRRASIDHVVPLRVAPELALESGNLRLVHVSCNSSRAGEKAVRTYTAARSW